MRTLSLSVFINRPPQEVFDYMTDPENDPIWQRQIVASEWVTPGPTGAGSTKRVVTRAMGRQTEALAEYTAWERPKGYAFTSDTGAFSIAGAITLEAQGGGTLVQVQGQVEASGMMKVTEGLIARQVERQDHNNFNRLKTLLEGG